MNSLYESFTCEGFWWLPQTPEIKVAGKLVFKPGEQIILSLMMTSTEYYSYFEKHRTPQIIQGNSVDGKKITLVYCNRWGKHSSNYLDIDTIQYAIQVVLDGGHYYQLSDLHIASMSINYSYLRDWMAHLSQGINEKTESNADEIIQSVEYRRKDPDRIYVDTIEATIYLGFGLEGIINYPRAVHWEEVAYLQITPDSPQSLEWFLIKSAIIRNMLAFLIGIPVYRTNSTAYIDDNTSKNHINIYYAVGIPKTTPNSMITDVMLFALEHLEDRKSAIFQAWFKKQDQIEIPIELALGVLYGNHRFSRFEYLALIQALESYHKKVAKPSWKEDCQKLYGKNDWRCGLKGRLNEMYENLPPELKIYLNFNEGYLKTLVDTRNYYTHYGEKAKHIFNNDSDVQEAITRLATFISILIFKDELNIPSLEIKEALQRVQGYGIWWRGSHI